MGLDIVLGNALTKGVHKPEAVLGVGIPLLGRQVEPPHGLLVVLGNGHRAITGDTALRLAHFFGTSAEFWLNLQKLYELRLAEKKASKAIKTLPTLKNEHVHV